MENNRILIDTSVIIEFFRKRDKEKTLLYRIFDSKLFVSAITTFEVFAGATSPDKEKDLAELFKIFTVLPFDSNCSAIAADLYN